MNNNNNNNNNNNQILINDDYEVDIEDQLEDPNLVQNFECCLCLNLLNKPYQCKQGHMYCLKCIEEHLKINRSCPVCKCVLDKNTLSKLLVIEKLIDGFNVYCKYKYKIKDKQDENVDKKKRKGKATVTNNKKIFPAKKYEDDPNGCMERIKYSDREKHQKQCQYGWERCKHYDPNDDKLGCNIVCRKMDMDEHLLNCSHRFIKCKLCEKDYRFYQKKTHENECGKVEITCKDCNTKILRDSIQNHLDKDCLEHEIGCPFDSTLCKEKMKRKDSKQHVKDQLVDHLILQNNSLTQQVKKLQQFQKIILDNLDMCNLQWIVNYDPNIESYTSPFVLIKNITIIFKLVLDKSNNEGNFDLLALPAENVHQKNNYKFNIDLNVLVSLNDLETLYTSHGYKSHTFNSNGLEWKKVFKKSDLPNAPQIFIDILGERKVYFTEFYQDK